MALGSLACAGGNDPLTCLVDPLYSSGTFLLGPGSHSISITVLNGVDGGGGAWFGFEAPSGAVPEPATTALVGLGLLGLAAWRRRSHAK